MSVVVLLPAELAKSRNREISLLEPTTVRRVRGFPKRLFLAFFFLLGVPATIFYWPVGVVALILDLYYWIRVIRIVKKSYSGKVFDVSCPNCEKINRHWSHQNFICTDCRHLLMRHGDRVYDVTESEVRALLDGGFVDTNYVRAHGKKVKHFS
jgi:hypothetical protein